MFTLLPAQHDLAAKISFYFVPRRFCTYIILNIVRSQFLRIFIKGKSCSSRLKIAAFSEHFHSKRQVPLKNSGAGVSRNVRPIVEAINFRFSRHCMLSFLWPYNSHIRRPSFVVIVSDVRILYLIGSCSVRIVFRSAICPPSSAHVSAAWLGFLGKFVIMKSACLPLSIKSRFGTFNYLVDRSSQLSDQQNLLAVLIGIP